MSDHHAGKKYFPNLDSLRFFAFFAVFISHAALFLGYENQTKIFTTLKTYILANGDVGVSFFFVLSGFLITFILLQEKNKNRNISLKKFYIKRILRIWPVYFIALILGFFVLPFFMHALIGNAHLPFIANAPLNVLPRYLFFLANFSLAFHGGASVLTDILWSISVEEQFYLVWPFIVAFVPNKYLPRVLIGLIVASSIYKYVYAYDSYILAYSTFSVMSDLCIGSLLGYIAVCRQDLILKWKTIPKSLILSSYAGILLLVVSRHWYIPAWYAHKIIFPLVVSSASLLLAMLFAVVIYEQNEAITSFIKVGNLRIASKLGKISYGLYSYHMIAVALVLSIASYFAVKLSYSSGVVWLSFGVLSLLSTILIAHLSFRYIEKWFLDKKPN